MRKYILKICVFLVLVLVIITGLTYLYVDVVWNDSEASNRDFYALERNSVDAVFVGSSHIYCGFDPAVLENEYGISSYLLATPNQNDKVNYLFAKNAWNTQKYKYLLVDANGVYFSKDEYGSNKNSILNLWPSKEYFEYFKFVDARTALELMLPFFRIHDLWTSITNASKEYTEIEDMATAKGFIKLDSYSELTDRVIKYETDEISYDEDFSRFDLIKSFCDENGITMIVVKSVQAINEENVWNDIRHNTVDNWCNENSVMFLDFNTPELMAEAGLSISEDVAADMRHANMNGAQKETRYLGSIISKIE